MSLPARYRFPCVALLVILLAPTALSGTGTPSTTALPPAAASSIVIGFVGGFVSHDSPKHGPVKLAQSLSKDAASGAHIEVFENRRRRRAFQTVVRLLDANHDGVLSESEKAGARIILFGHSWGASAVVMLARELRRAGIPVLLTVQVDSVAKLWQNDSVIPDNVAEAVNYYQPHGIVHGRARITAQDPSKTQILGNHMVDYKKAPVGCAENSW